METTHVPDRHRSTAVDLPSLRQVTRGVWLLPVFGVRPDVDLALMRPGQTLAGLTARLMEALDGYLEADRPDLVLVQGDTTTGALGQSLTGDLELQLLTTLKCNLKCTYCSLGVGEVLYVRENPGDLESDDLNADFVAYQGAGIKVRLVASKGFKPGAPQEPVAPARPFRRRVLINTASTGAASSRRRSARRPPPPADPWPVTQQCVPAPSV